MSQFDIKNFFQRSGKKCGLLVLIDPDRGTPKELASRAYKAEKQGADAILIGGSFLLNDNIDLSIREIKKRTDLPVILFPGGGYQLSPAADGLLFLSLLSGRNPRWLIEEQVYAAPRVRKMAIPSIPTAYMLIGSGPPTSVSYMSNTTPIPRDKTDIAIAHAIAAEYLGMQAIYLEAGSGALEPVPQDLVRAIKENVSLPVIVGGGIKTIEVAAKIIDSGADFLVIGTAMENESGNELIASISSIIA